MPEPEAQVSEEKNPYFQEGKSRAEARDYKGAIEAFEKAVEQNPRSALAHFELGVLYEQHNEHSENDYIAAMYHYLQAMRLRAPTVYPYDNARIRLDSCKQELVKTESLAPVYQSIQAEIDRLREENQQLRKILETNAPPAGVRPPIPAQSPWVRPTSLTANSISPGHALTNSPRTAQAPAGRLTNAAPATTAGMRTYQVKAGDTPYSIARRHRIKLDSLMAANPGLDPRRLKTGQRLNIPAQ